MVGSSMQPWMRLLTACWTALLLVASGVVAATSLASQGTPTYDEHVTVPNVISQENDPTSSSRFHFRKVVSTQLTHRATAGSQQRHLQHQATSAWAITTAASHGRRELRAQEEADDGDAEEGNQGKAGNLKSKRTGSSRLYMLPWLLPPSQVKFPYNGAENNLRRLLRVQNKNRWITIFVFSTPVRRWVLNAIYSYVRIGRARSYIVATMDAASLAECKAFRLPCYDASYVDKELDQIAADAALRKKDDKANAVLAKIEEIRVALKKGRSGGSVASRHLQELNPTGLMNDILASYDSTHNQTHGSGAGGEHASSATQVDRRTGQGDAEDGGRLVDPGFHHQGQQEGNVEEELKASTLRQLLSASTTSSTGSTANIGSRDYLRMVWGKIVILRDVLRLGYHAHFSDVDVTYLREVYRSFNLLFLKYRVDAVLMKENVAELTDPDNPMSPVKRVNLLNTGVYVMRATNGTVRMVEDWLALSGPAVAAGLHDQAVFNLMAFTHYAVCAGMTTCMAARAAGWPTIYRHPQQFGMQVCPGLFSQPCDPMRLYVHAVCTSGWGSQEGGKAMYWTKYKLWLVDDVGHPLYRDDEQGNAAGVSKSQEPPPIHPFLPCPGPAWVSLQQQSS